MSRRRDGESTRFLELLLRVLPPALELRFTRENVGGQHARELHGRQSAIVAALKREPHEGGRIVGSEFLEARQIVRLACQKVLGRDRLEIVARVLELHGGFLARAKVNADLVFGQIPGGNAPKAPTLVRAVCARFQAGKVAGSGGGEFALVNNLLKLRLDGNGGRGESGHRATVKRLNRLR